MKKAQNGLVLRRMLGESGDILRFGITQPDWVIRPELVILHTGITQSPSKARQIRLTEPHAQHAKPIGYPNRLG